MKSAKMNSSILVDSQIIELVEKGSLISPFDPTLLSGCSYDLRVGDILISRNKTQQFDLKKESYIIETNECITIETLEEISLKDKNIFAIIVNKHSVLGHGLFHPITTVDPGFKSKLAITFFNLGHVPYTLTKGQIICNIYFHFLDKEPSRKYGENQTPTYKEGSVDFALIIKQPHVDLTGSMPRLTLGKPFSDIWKKIDELESKINKLDGQSELTYYKKNEEKGKDKKTGNRWIIGTVVSVLGLILAYIIFGGIKLYQNTENNTMEKDTTSHKIDTTFLKTK